jgi:hypothetical protein
MHAAAVGVPGAVFDASQIWAACGLRTPQEKLVRSFERHAARVDQNHILRAGQAHLVCGNAGYSYRHILKGHRRDWEYDACLVGSNWRDHADWAIEATLRDPQVVTYRSQNDSYCYSRAIQLWDKANKRYHGDRIIVVPVYASSLRIVTAFPNNEYCKG